jgi:hypothetical protein
MVQRKRTKDRQYKGKKKPLKHGIAMVFKLSDGYFTSIGGILKR